MKYFILTLDGEDDSVTQGGLEDDRIVLNAVLGLLGRDDLVVKA